MAPTRCGDRAEHRDRRHRLPRAARLARRGDHRLRIAPEARGHDYATESLVAIIEWALAQAEVNMVNADAALDNTASQAVMERAGMRFVEETTEKRYYRLP